ncbi:MAG: N-acetylmuramoyl-L-alanine amidase [Lentisphaeria bacterium]
MFILSVLFFLGGLSENSHFFEVCAASVRSPKTIRYMNLYNRRYLYLRDVASFYGMNYSIANKKVVMYSKYSRLEFKLDSRSFVLNRVLSTLSYAVFLNKNHVMIAENDFSILLDPVLRSRVLPRKRIQRIIIDPGHGGKDNGAEVAGVTEKYLNLKLALPLVRELQCRGYVVFLTRTSDVYHTLLSRAEMGKRCKADLFISLHCNAAADSSVHGVECYVANPQGTPSSGGNTIAKNKTESDVVVRENALLGHTMQGMLCNKLKCADRGFKRKQFMVLRKSEIPTILIETGFMTNPQEFRLLQNQYYRKKLVDAIADGVDSYAQLLKAS